MMEQGTKSGACRYGALSVVATVSLLACEAYYLLLSVTELCFPARPPGFLTAPGLQLAIEFLGRWAWVLLFWLLIRRIGSRYGARERRIVWAAWLTALILALPTSFFVVSALAGLKFPLAVLAWIRALEITLLLIWALAILFLIASEPIRNRPGRRWLFNLAGAGALVYFLLKGLTWLELIAGSSRFVPQRLGWPWLAVPLLVFLGRLALLRLLVTTPSALPQETVVEQQ